MNAPYKGTFMVSQIYKGAAHYGHNATGAGFKTVSITPGEIPDGYTSVEYALPTQSLEARIAALEGGT